MDHEGQWLTGVYGVGRALADINHIEAQALARVAAIQVLINSARGTAKLAVVGDRELGLRAAVFRGVVD
jgi:hypothetical protein